MADFAIYESLSREERIRRIGALFCKAVALTSAFEQRLEEKHSPISYAQKTSSVPEGGSIADLLQETDCALLNRFAPLGEFSPREATQFWDISRTSAYRRLQRLEHSGWIVRHGETSAARYRITTQTLPVRKQVE